MNNASQRLMSGMYTTQSNRPYRRLKPLNSAATPSKGRRTPTTKAKTTQWDGNWNPEWDELKSRPVTMRREEAALRAAGLWLTTADPSLEGSPTHDQIQELLNKIPGATTETSPANAAFYHERKITYPRTTLPTPDDEIEEASPFFMRKSKTKAGKLFESETEASMLGSAEDSASSVDNEASVDAGASIDDAASMEGDDDVPTGDIWSQNEDVWGQVDEKSAEKK